MKRVSIFNLFVIVFLYSLAANFAHPVTPTFIQNLGLHDYMFGLAFACMSLTNFLFSPFWGKMSAKYGSTNVLAISSVGYGIMQLLFGLSTKEWQICVCRLFAGFFISAFSVAQLIYVLDNSKNKGKDLAMTATINGIVSQFGFLIGGFLGDVSIKLTFVVQAISLSSIGILVFFILKDSKIGKTRFTLKEINPFADFIKCRDILTRAIVYFLIVVALSSFAAICYEQCFNYYIKDIFNFPASYNGIVKAIIGFVSFAANIFATLLLIKRTDTNLSIVYVNIVLIIMILGVVFIKDYIPFMVVNILFFSFNSVFVPILQDMLTHHKTKSDAEFAGLFNAIRMLGSVFGSLSAGFIYSSGPKLSFVVSAISLMICLIFTILHLKQIRITSQL